MNKVCKNSETQKLIAEKKLLALTTRMCFLGFLRGNMYKIIAIKKKIKTLLTGYVF